MDDSRRGDGQGDDRGDVKIAVRIDQRIIQLNIEGKRRTFSGNRDLREAMKLLNKQAGPRTAEILYLVTEVFREAE